jgi:transcriptional regulator with XRE-family HTH domain
VPLDPASQDRVAQELGRKVQRLRTRRQWTQEQLSAASGVSRNQIQNIEHSRNNARDPLTRLPGRGNPRLDTIFALAAALEVDVAVLIDPERSLPEPPGSRS